MVLPESVTTYVTTPVDVVVAFSKYDSIPTNVEVADDDGMDFGLQITCANLLMKIEQCSSTAGNQHRQLQWFFRHRDQSVKRFTAMGKV